MFHSSPCVIDTHVFLPTGHTVPGNLKRPFLKFLGEFKFLVTPFGEKRRYAVFWPFVVATDSAVETYESAKIGDRRFDFCTNYALIFTKKHRHDDEQNRSYICFVPALISTLLAQFDGPRVACIAAERSRAEKWLCCKVNEGEVSAYHARRFLLLLPHR